MFKTQKSAEIPLPLALYGEETKAWTSVALPLFIPWIIVVYEAPEEDGMKFKRTVLLSELGQIEALGNQACILEIGLVSPGYMNGEGRWKIDPLKEILLAEEPGAHGQETTIFVLEDGTRYADPKLSTRESELLSVHPIFQANAKKPSTKSQN